MIAAWAGPWLGVGHRHSKCRARDLYNICSVILDCQSSLFPTPITLSLHTITLSFPSNACMISQYEFVIIISVILLLNKLLFQYQLTSCVVFYRDMNCIAFPDTFLCMVNLLSTISNFSLLFDTCIYGIAVPLPGGR